MTPAQRYRMAAAMNLAPPMPTVSQRRAWEMIDSRLPPADGEPADGEFTNFQQWVNKASSWIGFTGARCFDAKDRPCHSGADMMRARDENAFPVRWYWPDRYPAAPAVSRIFYSILRTLISVHQTTDHDGLRYSELRRIKGLGNLSRKQFESLCNHPWMKAADGKVTLTDEGFAEAIYLHERVCRASFVRSA